MNDMIGSWCEEYPDGEHSEPRLNHLRREIAVKIPDQWKDVGYELHLDHEDLKSIEGKYQDSKEKFTEVFELWRNQGGCHGHVREYKWKCILEVLNRLKQCRLEKEIRARLTKVPSKQLVPTN